MTDKPIWPGAAFATAAALALMHSSSACSQGFGRNNPPVRLNIKENIEVPAADATSTAIVAAAKTFLDTLSAQQKDTALYRFTDNAQRANWSNFPNGAVRRGGVMVGDLSAAQRSALDALLAVFMSDDGFTNIVQQLTAEEMLRNGRGSGVNFGRDFYFVSFLGEPSTTAPWMFQFGGHHLAINATVVGPNISYAPMLTGGQPMHIRYQGREIFITERETAAAQAFMDSLNDALEKEAVRSARPINLLLGPGRDGTVLAPEGVRGSDLSSQQKKLLLEVIRARLGFINDDDFAQKMQIVEAQLDDTYFGWWGPQGQLGTAYYRVTGPSIVLEYAPQGIRGGTTDHVHAMYREPGNDYGALWIGAD